ncbi:pectinesterase inhibitor 10-like [Durio zibethinus]|uniref:Pectinesterase inhibitor 10-like n=1 Tax=Durio zibethinus TaxID=66656 RepID=A0A6P5YD88_DURZI|nr:pectinesterase inhibitor 10-like [Durio zibethinus]
MARTFSIHALIILLILLQLSSYFNTCSATTKSHLSHHRNKEYIKNSCSATTYPKLCYKSLAHHASKIQGNPKLLAHAALNATFFAAKATSRLLRDMSTFHGLRRNEAAAMIDCVEDVSDAVQKLQKSTKEMDRTEGSDHLRVQMNDIQMWVNTALEEEETCMNALANKAIKHRVKNGVRRRIIKVAHLTSNALALVKSFALAEKNSP